MRYRVKYFAVLGCMMLLAALLCGCDGSWADFSLTPEELYALPELPAKYTALNQQLSAILEDGAEYAAPAAGANIQPVQMVDLDGDGREEAVAFFRRAEDEKPLKICVFRAEEDHYQSAAMIEGSGTSVYSIAYNDLNSDGQMELIVGWRAGAELQALTVYALWPNGPEELVRTDYIKYAVSDLDGDGRQELTVLRNGVDGGVAECYRWQTGQLTALPSVRLSMTMAELSQQGRVTVGTLKENVPALFVTGVADSSWAVTDVLILQEEEMKNIMLSAVTGVSGEIAPFRSLYPQDINNDGVTEIPRPVSLATWDHEEDDYLRIAWQACDAAGETTTVLSTYHAVEDGWYLRLPEAWEDTVLAERTSLMGENSVTFYVRGGTEPVRPFLRISALTGTNRDRQALQGGRFSLSRRSDVIYTAELLEGNSGWKQELTEDEVRSAFSLIAADWSAGGV